MLFFILGEVEILKKYINFRKIGYEFSLQVNFIIYNKTILFYLS